MITSGFLMYDIQYMRDLGSQPLLLGTLLNF